MLILIITLLVGFFLGKNSGTKKEETKLLREFNEEDFQKTLCGKTEDELWSLRNHYQELSVGSEGTIYQKHYLDCIGVIDKQIYTLRHQ